ncbi:alpha-tocopherol transfer protein-like [Brevipalpus obovatus]|uniref:alpha-tocopherol transfer protein-like n=1 Tax=Brevipalpus obovatus TaxID=246614 RepID=UPI003D9F298E
MPVLSECFTFDNSKPLINDYNCLNKLSLLIRDDPILHCYNFSDKFLLIFLRHRKFDVLRALHQLRCYIKKVITKPEFFCFNIDFINVIQSGVVQFQEENSTDGSAIVLCRPGLWKPEKTSLIDLIRLSIMYISIRLENVECNGHIIVDASDLSLNQILSFGISGAKMLIDIFISTLPVKVKKIHLIRGNRLLSMGIKLFWPFISEKIKKRVINHENRLDEIFECCPRSVLPTWVGGDIEDDLSGEKCIQKIMAGSKMFKEVWNQVQRSQSKLR